MYKRLIHVFVLSLALVSVGCGYSEEEMNDARDQAIDEAGDAISNALRWCETDISGVVMDDGCLEDEFYYQGDFWDCEVGMPSETLVDAECVRSRLGL